VEGRQSDRPKGRNPTRDIPAENDNESMDKQNGVPKLAGRVGKGNQRENNLPPYPKAHKESPAASRSAE
jgi:hypothetical protein